MNSFRQFLSYLNESISLTETSFGTKKPFDDKRFNRSSDYIYTFFEHENQIVVVSYDDNHSLNFGILKNGESIVSKSESNFSFKNMLNFYGKVLYVFNEMVKQYNISMFIVYSAPSELQLKRLYDKFATNKQIISVLSSIGFKHYEKKTVEEFHGTTFEVHQFSKPRIEVLKTQLGVKK